MHRTSFGTLVLRGLTGCMLLGVLGLWLVRDQLTKAGGSYGMSLALIYVAVVLFAIRERLAEEVKKLESMDVAWALRNDSRVPILYLRAFEEDGRRILPDPDRLHWLAALGFMPTQATREEGLVAALLRFGPVIAIHRPDDELPQPGAARVRLRENWETSVQWMIGQAALVVLRPGEGQGVAAEMRMVVSENRPDRFLLYVEELEPDAWRLFRASNTGLPHPLPEDVRKVTFVGFDHNWRARPYAATWPRPAREQPSDRVLAALATRPEPRDWQPDGDRTLWSSGPLQSQPETSQREPVIRETTLLRALHVVTAGTLEMLGNRAFLATGTLLLLGYFFWDPFFELRRASVRP